MSNRKGLLVLLVAGSIVACKKNDNSFTVASTTMTATSQSVYQVRETAIPVKGTIVVAPFLINVPDSGQLLVMDEHGTVLQQKMLPGAGLDFRKWTIDGQTRYTYIVNDVNAYHIPVLANFAGYLVVADSLLNEITRINLLPFDDVDPGDGHALDVHDFIYLSDNHYITEAYYDKHATNIPAYLPTNDKNKIVAPVIQEVENGTVIWQWDGSKDSSFYNSSMVFNNYADTTVAQDYMHLNAMTIDPRDNNLIVSFRSQSQIIKIDRSTGKVLWKLGGKNSDFPLTDEQVFLFQHDPTLTDNNTTLILFDNGDLQTRPYSRILEFKLDEVNKQVTGFSAFTIPEAFSMLMGSVQKFGDVYFIGGGTGNYVLEVNHVTNQKIIEMKSSKITYRAYKYE